MKKESTEDKSIGNNNEGGFWPYMAYDANDEDRDDHDLSTSKSSDIIITVRSFKIRMGWICKTNG